MDRVPNRWRANDRRVIDVEALVLFPGVVCFDRSSWTASPVVMPMSWAGERGIDVETQAQSGARDNHDGSTVVQGDLVIA